MSETPALEYSEEAVVKQLQGASDQIRSELRKFVIGQDEAVEQLLIAVLSGGHCLITGAPGLAKTLLVKSLSEVFSLELQRIQFTPDLMPADITGTEILQETEEGRRMRFVKGPVFANMILADEINRTPPKTQAALLEAMQEHQVTAAGVTHKLSEPFFVVATQNPIEMEGTYPLPEDQLDRFMFNVVVDYLSESDEVAVVAKTTTTQREVINQLFSGEDIQRFHHVVRQVPIAEDVVRYAVQIAAKSRPNRDGSPDFVNEWVNWGAGLRAAQFMVLGAKTRALLAGRSYVANEDIKALAVPVLRHRVLVNYRAEAEGIQVEDIIQRLVNEVTE